MNKEEFEKWLLDNWFVHDEESKRYLFCLDPTDCEECFSIFIR